ncbi:MULTISPECIES: hypothetical protein [Actinomadura]|uniref:Uncharacterized protein n=1 Tax=Actinomadura litoris TaxID=2678616 RepID=A0A7K1L1X1_9ACTN|nr:MULTISPECIES: hypothetical protein [Actinomadura]MBT2206499.1 hypothetical protein [Actinomadura sp. NEAU-AAG7]MUN38401.1 hypothetical protein [Actinomadura litoris]
MPVPASALARLRRARRRRRRPARVTRRFVARPACASPARKDAPDEPDPGRAPRPESSWAWTLYSRWEWITATARAERVLRRSRPPWH